MDREGGPGSEVATRLQSENRLCTVAGFHAQQAVEKYLKALLVRHQIEFRKTHDIKLLLDLVARIDAAMAEGLRTAENLTPFGVAYRYPGDYPEMLLGDAAAAAETAHRVRQTVMAILKAYLHSE